MTNEAISAILEHLCNEARNSMHATLGVMELLRETITEPSQRASVAIGRASADQLLRSIDDVRELLSTAPGVSSHAEEFDVTMCAGEIIELLNLASTKRRRHMVLDAPSEPLMLTQDRKAVEQVLTRILDTAFKLAQLSDVHVKLSPSRVGNGAWVAIHGRDADLAARLTNWLNASSDRAVLQDPGEVPFEVAVMVAGKGLRGLGGRAELEHDAAGHSIVSLDFPMQALAIDEHENLSMTSQPSQPDALNILIAEDCDDSFVLSELMLQDENVRRARDGREALEMIQRHRFDIVFMDIHMPGLDGYSAIRSMREWETETGNARTPIVVLSSDDLETQRRRAAQNGCSGFLRKPLRRDDLSSLLDRVKQGRTPPLGAPLHAAAFRSGSPAPIS
jgi:CheY-like chemotaxis protein